MEGHRQPLADSIAAAAATVEWKTPGARLTSLILPLETPSAFDQLLRGYRAVERIDTGQSGGAVHRLHGPDLPGLYLKHGVGEVAEEIAKEHERLGWLARRWAVPQVRGFVHSTEGAWLLTSELSGRTAYQCLQAEPAAGPAIVVELVRGLRALHALPPGDCPFRSDAGVRLAEARQRLEAGRIDAGDFGEEHAGWTPTQVWHKAEALLPAAQAEVVTHGDFSLDNLLLQDGRLTGGLDVSRLGVADRYQDLAILWDCLGEFGPELQALLFREYGLAGPDPDRLALHLALDECF